MAIGGDYTAKDQSVKIGLTVLRYPKDPFQILRAAVEARVLMLDVLNGDEPHTCDFYFSGIRCDAGSEHSIKSIRAAFEADITKPEPLIPGDLLSEALHPESDQETTR